VLKAWKEPTAPEKERPVAEDEPEDMEEAVSAEPAELTEEIVAAEESSPRGDRGFFSGIRRVWKDFVQFAKKKKPPFASLLEHAHPLVLNETVLEIGYPEKSFYLERMQEADNGRCLKP